MFNRVKYHFLNRKELMFVLNKRKILRLVGGWIIGSIGVYLTCLGMESINDGKTIYDWDE